MYFPYFVLALTYLAGNSLAGFTNYFYSGIQTPITPNYYQQSFAPNYFQQPFIPQVIQPYTPAPQFYQAPQTFGYQQSFPVQYFPVQDNYNIQSHVRTSPQATEETKSNNEKQEINYETQQNNYQRQEYNEQQENNYERQQNNNEGQQNNNGQNQEDNYRGYAYHNQFKSGSSHVVFLTGPEVHNIRTSLSSPTILSSRTSASDAVDSNAGNDNDLQSIDQDQSIEKLVKYLENPELGIQRFYSVNNKLVARTLEDEINQQPGITLPFTQPITPIFPALRSRFSIDRDEKPNLKDEPVGSASNTESESVKAELPTTQVTTVAPTSTTTTTTAATTTTTSTTTAEADKTSETSTTARTEESKSTEVASTTLSSTTNESTVRNTMEPIIVE